jgi:hypothetical protein
MKAKVYRLTDGDLEVELGDWKLVFRSDATHKHSFRRHPHLREVWRERLAAPQAVLREATQAAQSFIGGS